MRRYLESASRYRWIIVLVLALTWGTGAVLAYSDYTTSFEADATIWTDRQSQQFATTSTQDPGFGSVVTPAAEQAGVLNQLLQSRSFLQDVTQRAFIVRPAGTDERTFFADIGKRFRIDVLGTNLFRLSYRALDPHTGPAIVNAALAIRQQRLAETRAAATTAAATYYRTELELAQNQALAAQSELDAFDAVHKLPLGAPDDYQQRQLRLAVEEAKTRVLDVRTRIDGSTVLPAIFQLADSVDFQVLDEPIEDAKPSGGLRPAMTTAGAAGIGGLALIGLLVLAGTLIRGSARERAAQSVDPQGADLSNPTGLTGPLTSAPASGGTVNAVERNRTPTPSNAPAR
jgi:hypothetical protein